MTYRNDHDAALDRIVALEQENRRLADEAARARPDANAVARIQSLEQANRRLAEQVARSLPRRIPTRSPARARLPASPVEWALVVTFGVVWLIVTIATSMVG